jgi:hypothetical protein
VIDVPVRVLLVSDVSVRPLVMLRVWFDCTWLLVVLLSPVSLVELNDVISFPLVVTVLVPLDDSSNVVLCTPWLSNSCSERLKPDVSSDVYPPVTSLPVRPSVLVLLFVSVNVTVRIWFTSCSVRVVSDVVTEFSVLAPVTSFPLLVDVVVSVTSTVLSTPSTWFVASFVRLLVRFTVLVPV